MEKNMKICVTGGESHLGSWLVKELLQRGYTVHATLKNLGDESIVGLLKGLPHADTRLKLFKADIYKAHEFESAIQGCEVVIHLATPMTHDTGSSQFKNTCEAAVGCVRSIMDSCMQSGTVRRFIYTSSVVASSPLKDDGSSFKDSLDETCWTSPNVSVSSTEDFIKKYTASKTVAEKEVLSYKGGNVEVVTLACGTVGGDTLLSSLPLSQLALVSQITSDHMAYRTLRSLEELVGKIPILHIEDAIAAHIFCMDKSVPIGRYLCANGFLKTAEIAEHYLKHHPHVKIHEEFIEDTMRTISWGSRKLEDLGFHYKYDVKKTLDQTLQCAKRMGYLN